MSFKIKYKIIYQDVIKKVEIQYIKKEDLGNFDIWREDNFWKKEEDEGQLEKSQQWKSLIQFIIRVFFFWLKQKDRIDSFKKGEIDFRNYCSSFW